MQIALLGYGRMGQMVETLARTGGHHICGIASSDTSLEEKKEMLQKADAAIEFTNAEGVMQHIDLCLEAGVPIVTGSTGWQHRMEEVRSKAIQKNGCVVYGSNFSVGMQVFFRMNNWLAGALNHFGYSARLMEAHHAHKKDAPSGTAISLAEQLMHQMPRYKEIKVSEVGGRESHAEDELPVLYMRKAEIKGIHEIGFTSPADTITIRHEAHNREGFAAGAILVAEKAVGKKGFFLAEDIFEEILS